MAEIFTVRVPTLERLALAELALRRGEREPDTLARIIREAARQELTQQAQIHEAVSAPLSELVSVTMTENEKRVLYDMAHANRVPMRHVLRRLVRQEAQRRGLWPIASEDGR